MSGKLFVISAPSGAGKTSLVKVIVDRLGQQFPLERLVTYTTKKPSSQEREGEDYYFISVEEFERKIAEGFFIEWSAAYGAYYGSPRDMRRLLGAGKFLVVVVDRYGARKMAEVLEKRPVLIWVQPPDERTLLERLFLRGRDVAEDIQKRIELGRQELAEEQENSFYTYQIINDNFHDAVQQLEEIFLKEILSQ